MAFLRTDKKADGTYLRIVKSRRENGKVIKQTVYSLGKVSDYTAEQLKRFGEKFYALGGSDPRELLDGSIEETGRHNYGYYQLFRKIFSIYGLDKLLLHIEKKHQLGIDLVNAVMLMLLERLHDPCSKLQNYFHQQEYIGIKQVELHHLYRSLDYLFKYSGQVQQRIFQSGRDLFNQQLDVVFYDVTTLYFESDVEEENALRQKGFSKDGKVGNTQILFGLLIDKNKQPIGYKIYKGDTFEGHTFEKALLQLKEQYQIKNIVLVADRGMLSKHNITVTENHHYEFILGEKLKSLSKNIQSYFFNLENYKQSWVYNHNDEPIAIRYCTLEYEGKTIIGTYSEKRAKKDRKEREEKVEKAKQLIHTPHLLRRKAHHYFLQSENKETYSLNEEKIKQSQRYDGFLAIATNNNTFSTTDILDNYRHLFQIEHTFRTFKSYLETRPVFHWTDKRIEGHMCLCYIAYALLTFVQNKMEKSNIHITENQLRKSLDSMQVSYIKNKNDFFYLRSAGKEQTDAIIGKMGLKKLPNILPAKEISSYL